MSPRNASKHPFLTISFILTHPQPIQPRLFRLGASLLLSMYFGLLIWSSLPVAPTLAQGTANLGLSKTFAGGSGALVVESGEEFTYYLAYSCSVSGLGDCEDVVITDTLDSALEYRSLSGLPAGATVDLTNLPTVVINLGTVNDGDNRVLQLNVRFTPGTEPGTVAPNSATIDASNGDPQTSGPINATATGQFEMTASKTMANDADDRVIGNQFVTNYRIQICSPDETGGIRLTNPTIVDTLPPQATFISANPTATYISATHTLSWTHLAAGGSLPDVIEVGGCYNTEVRVSFPGGGGVVSGTVVTNIAQVTGAPEFGPPASYDSGPLPHNLTLIDPYYAGSFGKSSASASTFAEIGQTEELPGRVVTYTITYANDGTVPILNAVVSDTIPASQTVQVIFVDVISDPVTLLYQSAQTSGWQSFPGNSYSSSTNVTSATLGLAPTDSLTALRWEIGDLPLDAATWRGGFTVQLDPATPFSQTAQNCAGVAATWDDQGAPTPETHTACANVTTIDTRAIPRTYKSVSDSSVLPEDVVTITLRAVNEDVAHLPVYGPITLADVLLEALEVVVPDAGDPSGYRAATALDSWYTFTSTNSAPAPTATLTLNYKASPQTFVSWAWPGSYQQNPGDELEVSFAARIKKGTFPATLDNRSLLLWGPTTVNALDCTGGNLYTDSLDIDNDTNTTETGCRSNNTPTTVEVFLSMSSEKHVLGQLDSGWNKDGLTMRGGAVDYMMSLTNTSNVTVTDIVVYDILPFVGDVGVIDGQPRQTVWRPNLQAPLSVPPGLPLTIYYSRAQNPCRPEVLSDNPTCVDDWSTSPPADITSVQALKFDFCQGVTCLELGPETGSGNGGSLDFTWHMVAPNDAPLEPDRAWNTFGFTAFQKDGIQLKLPPAEPNKVGIRVQALDENYFHLGNFVWFDVYGQQNDGLQQPEEVGVNGVRVELWQPGPDTLPNTADDVMVDLDSDGQVDYRVTGPNVSGQPGYYLFTNLPPTQTYTLRFFPPLTHTVNTIDYPLTYTASISNTGADDALDSDGETLASDPTYGSYLQSAVISPTAAITTDLTWDQGIWLPTDYGDAPGPYPTEVGAQANPADAARHVILPGLYLGSGVDAELDGQPHSQAWGDDLNTDDEDGVEFEHFVGTAALPSAVMILGETASLTVTTAVPIAQTGYLNAWLDFNGDGDWTDPGEQIAANQSPSGGQVVLNSIAVPASVTTYTTYARFRFSTEPNLTPTGAAQDGEVEDYQVQFIDPPQKQLIATSENHTSGGNLALGEIARYRLTVPVPQGTLTNFTITDTLPAGLQFLDDGTATVVFSATTSLTSDPLVISGGPFSSGTDPIFALGTVVNNDTDVTDEEYVNLEFNALVTNTSGNQNNSTLDNRFTVTYDSFRATSAPVTITVVEPAITNLNKTVTVTPDDAGDPAGYQLTFSNSGATTAFNVVLTDTLDLTYLELVPGSVTLTPAGGASGLSDLSAGNTLTVTVDTLPVGGSVTVAYSATVTSAAIPGNTIPNTATLIYTSLPLTGTAANPTGSLPPGGSGDPAGERDGSGGVNDYSDSDTAGVTIAAPVPVKTLVSTSAGHTGFVAGRENLAIGEIARFRLVAELPEGSAPLLQFRDLMPNNLRFLNDNTATVAFVANGAGITSTTLISGTLGCDGGANPTLHFSGSSAAGVTPDCLLPNSTVGSNSANGSDQDLYISGTDVYFKLGSVVNHDDDADAEFVIVEFNALATDIATNQAGTTFDNRFDVRLDNDADNSSEQVAQSGTVPLRIAEPALSLTKLLNTAAVDAGDTISYTITLQNIASGNGAADAFDLVLTDTLDSNLTLAGWNIAAPGGRTVTDTTSAPTLAIAVDQLALGESVSVVLTATVSAGAPAGQTIPNTAYLLYTSLPGPQGTTPNPTGSTTPGVPGDTEGERDGSDGNGGSPNDYAAQAAAPLLIEGSAPAKQLVGTSAAHTTGTDVTIGEVLTYSLAVAVPEGIISSLAVTDTLPAGLAYNGSIAFDTSAFNGTFSPGDPIVSSGGGSGDEVVIRYSSPITVPADNIAGNNGFTITLQAVVTDVVGNVGVPPQTDLPNTATIHLGGATPVTSPPITATVVEPQVVITKSIVPAAVAAGDFITVSLTVRNAGLSNAFEVVVEDPLPTALFIALSEGSTPAGFSYSTVPAGANTIVRYTGGHLAVNETVTFTFRAQLTTPVSKDLIHTNVATVTQATTLPGSDPNERDEPDVSDDDTVTLIALSLGNQVWFDANNNGLLDGGESGLDGVRLNLLNGAGTPITDTLTSLPITTTTGGGGFYIFTDLVAGDYIVEIDPANFGAGQPLVGYFSSTGATDPDGDLDSDDNGLDDSSPAVNGLRSLPVTLAYNGETLGNEDGDSDPNSNLTVDFGLFSADYGDLPDSYGTTDSAGGAFHTLSAGLYLGSRVDAELDGQPSPTATGDDSAAGPSLPTPGDDEDGITFDTPLIPGEVATITVQAVGSANFSGWIDFDGSGAFAPGERIFTNTAVLSGTTALGFNVPAGAVPGTTGVRLRYSSDSLTSHAGWASDGEVEDYVVQIVALDYGDLPASYPTRTGSNPARHIILTVDNPTLGATVDEETDGAASANADGDDLSGGDDEDGVLFSGDFFPGQTTTITVTALTTGTLNAWIDWTGDGDFSDGGEQIATAQTLNAGANLVLPLTVPLTATQGITAYSRFRFSSDPGLTPGGLAADGEVEDYATPLWPLDWGDLPDSTIPATPNYPTRAADDGPRHVIVLGNNPVLGSRVDAESDGQPAAAANADDLNNGPIHAGGSGDDEDGVIIPTLVPGTTVTVTVTYSNPTAGNAYLNGWLDYDGNGSLDQIAADTLLPPGSSGTLQIPINVPLSANQGTVYSRFRLSSQSGLGLTGFAPDGEVEDHPTMLADLDWGDLPHDGPGPLLDYPTREVANGARHLILAANNPTLGLTVDSEADGQPTAGADGDDSNGDDEDGVTFSGPLVPGEVLTVTVTASADAAGLLNGWIDFNGNGTLGDSGEQIALNQAIIAGATLQIPVNVPASAAQGMTTYARFRFSSDSDLAPTGLASDGEVEDYALSSLRLDYGDLPNDGPGGDPDFPVLYADDGPRHIIDPIANPVLGATVDHESNGQPAVSANGDDLNGDDEDGITFAGLLIPGQTITVTVSYSNPTGGNTYLNAWFDSNGDGGLEQIATDQVVPPGTGTVPISVPIPPTAAPGALYSRFRLSSASGLGLTGLAGDGEVEDYVITLQPALPAVAISKTASAARIAPNHGLLTYTIRITNTGNVPLNPVRLTDTLETGLSYGAGTANPPASSVTGQQLVWHDLTAGAGLAPGSSLLVTLGANVPATPGVYRNTVVVEGTHPVSNPTATDEAPVAVEDPSLVLNKTLAAPGVVGDLITFTIQITNTGPTALASLPLFDSFTGPLAYVGGTPLADQIDNGSGQLAWTNLVDHFGLIDPAQRVTIQTVFRVLAGTGEFSATNLASTTGGLDTHGNPTNDDDDQVELINVPTAVDLLYFRSRSLAGSTLLEWATAVEYDNFGFALLRSETGKLGEAEEIAFVEGQGLGTVQGQSYSYTDSTVTVGRTYTYWLVDIDFDGVRTVHPAQSTTVTVTSAGSVRLYLPLIVK